ncbi:MAG: carboxylating nicotinate-nucleotide diphosphorylase [Betaproteobacteria bacterium]
MPKKLLENKLKALLADDVGQGDATSTAIIPPGLNVNAQVIAKESGVAAGINEAILLTQAMGLEAKAHITDGEKIKTNQILMTINGDAQTILTTERTLLNMLSRMSGIATQTANLQKKLQKAGVKTKIAATRKTAPGLLYFDKKAVAIGGGDPHRLHLDDMILIKDNHLAIIGDIEAAVKKAKAEASFSKKIEVEVTNDADAQKAAKAGADVIMLDNFSPAQAKATGEKLRKTGLDNVLIEVSGGVTSENLLEYAKAEVDVISIGALTHSVKALDISLEITKPK